MPIYHTQQASLSKLFKRVEKNSPLLRNFVRAEWKRTGRSNVDQEHARATRKQYSLDQSCLVQHNEALGFMFAQICARNIYSCHYRSN